jgi:hypothetical protein
MNKPVKQEKKFIGFVKKKQCNKWERNTRLAEAPLAEEVRRPGYGDADLPVVHVAVDHRSLQNTDQTTSSV